MCLNYQDSLLRGCSSRPYEVLLDRLFRMKRALYDLPMGKRKSTAFALLRERVRALPTRSISPCKEKKNRKNIDILTCLYSFYSLGGVSIFFLSLHSESPFCYVILVGITSDFRQSGKKQF